MIPTPDYPEVSTVSTDAFNNTVTMDRDEYTLMAAELSTVLELHRLLRDAGSLLLDYLDDPEDPEETLRAIGHWIRDHTVRVEPPQ